MSTSLPTLETLEDFLEVGGSLDDSDELMAVLLHSLQLLGQIMRNIESSEAEGLNKTILVSLVAISLEHLESLELLVTESIPALSHQTYQNLYISFSEAREYLLELSDNF